MDFLVVVDMQNDFIDGALGTPEAQRIVPRVANKIETFQGGVVFTRDTHGAYYPATQEGKRLPVMHCIEGTPGWQLRAELFALRPDAHVFDKPTFGSIKMAEYLTAQYEQEPIETITLIGLCTDICVISNALLLKAAMPETRIVVDAACCAGVTPDSHAIALAAMQACQVDIINA